MTMTMTITIILPCWRFDNLRVMHSIVAILPTTTTSRYGCWLLIVDCWLLIVYWLFIFHLIPESLKINYYYVVVVVVDCWLLVVDILIVALMLLLPLLHKASNGPTASWQARGPGTVFWLNIFFAVNNRYHALICACVHMCTCRLACKEAELQNAAMLLLDIFGCPLLETITLMHDILKTQLQPQMVITYV